jgi:hypothetical protein
MRSRPVTPVPWPHCATSDSGSRSGLPVSAVRFERGPQERWRGERVSCPAAGGASGRPMSSTAQHQPRPSWRHDFKPGEVENGFVEYYAAWSALGLAPVIVAVSADALISEKHETLQEWLDRHPRGPERDTMGRCLRARVVELHSHGYCHRDLHRDNVLIRHDGVPLFIDPAFAVAADPEAPCYDLVGGSRSESPWCRTTGSSKGWRTACTGTSRRRRSVRFRPTSARRLSWPSKTSARSPSTVSTPVR